MKTITLKVSGKSNATAVASAIAKGLEEDNTIEATCVGAAAVNQTVKAIAIARGFAAPVGKNIMCIPIFTTIKINEESRTAITFKIFSKN